MLHKDPAVDRAMRANIGKGYHFFDPDNQRFHKSRSVAGVESRDGRFVYVVERYRTVYMGGVVVQTPHSRVVRVDLSTGETDCVTEQGKPTSEMVGDRYVNNGEACHYSTNARALKAARSFAGIDDTPAVGDTVKIGHASRAGVVRRVDNRRKVAIVDWGNGLHGPEPLSRLTRVAP